MGNDLGTKLEALGRVVARVKFSLDASTLNQLSFEARRQNHTLIFKHDNMEVKVSDWALVPRDFEEHGYRAVDKASVRNYFYSAQTEVQVGKLKASGKCMLGYWKSRHTLLTPLGNTRERDVIDSLLLAIDDWAGQLFFNEMLEPEKFRARGYPEDYETETQQKVF